MKKNIILFFSAVSVAFLMGLMVLNSAFSLDAGVKKGKKEKVTAHEGGSATVTREVTVGSFNSISAEGPVKVIFTQGKTGVVTLSGGATEMEHIKVAVKDSELEIGFDKEFMRSCGKHNGKKGRREVEVRVSAPSLKNIETACSARFVASVINVDGKLEVEAETSGSVVIDRVSCGSLKADADTSSSVEIGRFQASEVKAEADTSGRVKISGTASAAKLEADTSGKVEVESLDTDNLKADADTSGSVKVKSLTAGTVTAEADTSGKIVLAGQAGSVVFRADTSGSVDGGKLSADYATVSTDTGGNIRYCSRNTNASSRSIVNTYNK